MIYYNSLNSYCQKTFGSKVYKLSLTLSDSCPNRDGTKGYGGCAFCLEGSSAFAPPYNMPIAQQIEFSKKLVSKKGGEKKYIAYFSAYTSTYCPIDRFKEYLFYVAEREDIVAISLGTRPDCLGEEILEILNEVNKIKPVWVELGLQTIHKSSADFINRCSSLSEFDSSIEKLHSLNIKVILHIILGLPNESEEMILQTVKYAADKNVFGIKLQLLHILKGTPFEKLWQAGKIKTMEMDEYISLLEKCVALLPKDMILHRLTGDGDKKNLLSPLWSGDKKRVLGEISKKITPR